MRTIEKKMIAAIRNNEAFQLDNTQVIHDDGTAYIYLHGHCIAQHDPDGCVAINLCGWDTRTTRSRLSAILQTFTSAYGVGTRNGVAEIRYPSHARKIESHGWYAI